MPCPQTAGGIVKNLWIVRTRGSRGGLLILLLRSLDKHSLLEDGAGPERATRCGPLTARRRGLVSLEAMANPAAPETGPLVTRV